MNKEKMKAIGYRFMPGDYHLVLAFDNPQKDLLEALHCFEQFKANIKGLCARYGKSIRLFGTTHEHYEKTHFHVLIPRLPKDEILAAWPYGCVRCFELKQYEKNSGFVDLIEYMLLTNKEGAEAPSELIIEKAYRS